MSSVLSDFFLKSLPVIFFGDEIEALFVPNEKREENSYSRAVRELYTLGRCSNALSILSGSSFKTAAFAFQDVGRIGLDPALYAIYPSFNNSCYDDYRMMPIRDLDELRKVLDRLSPPNDLSEEENWKRAQECFRLTGGVFRRIVKYVQINRWRITDREKYDFEQTVLSDQCLARAYFLLSDGDVKSIGKNELSDDFQSDIELNSKIYTWIEASLIFRPLKVNSLEFLYPWHAEVLKEEFGGAKMTFHETLAFVVTLKSESGTPGSTIENVVRRTVVESFMNSEASPESNFGKVTVSKNSLRKADAIPVRRGTLVHFAKETGIDFVLFGDISETAVHCHVGQIKAGKRKLEHLPGNSNSQCIGQILKKFSTGMKDIRERIQKDIARRSLVVDSFSLLSSLGIRDDALQSLKNDCKDGDQKVNGFFLNYVDYLPDSVKRLL